MEMNIQRNLTNKFNNHFAQAEECRRSTKSIRISVTSISYCHLVCPLLAVEMSIELLKSSPVKCTLLLLSMDGTAHTTLAPR